MKRNKLVSGEQAVPRKKQHKKPCSDCPWRRDALPNWLGSESPESWVALAHGEGTADCHTCGNQQCAGLAIYRANVCKTPRDPNVLQLPKDTKTVFASATEFLKHHYEEE